MGLFSRIFGTEKAITKTIDTATKAFDALVFTDEEKSKAAAQDRAEARKMVVEWMRTTSGQHLSRRFLAVLIATVWVVQYLSALGLHVAAVWVDEPGKLQASAGLIAEASQQMNGAVMLILAFYFAAPHMGQIVGPALQRFGGRGQGGNHGS